MNSPKKILGRINSVSLLRQITSTMKLISVSKLMKVQGALRNMRSFLDILNKMQEDVLGYKNIDICNDIEISDKTLLIPIGADKGFCGSFNNNICKSASKYINKDVKVMPIGAKVFLVIKKMDCNLISENVSLLKKTDVNEIKSFSSKLYNSLLDGTYSNIVFLYNKFVTTSSQVVVFENIKISNLINNSFEEKYNSDKSDFDKNSVIYESSCEDISKFFKEQIFTYKILNIMYESITSENACRMVNMNKASDNAESLLKHLRILYNQSRQLSITNEIIEVSAGARVLKK